MHATSFFFWFSMVIYVYTKKGGIHMNLDPEQISKKKSAITCALMFTFGIFGAHRFYVGKWKSGILYLIFGSIVPGAKLINATLKLFGEDSLFKLIWYVYISFVLVCVAILYDAFALYSESFTDVKGKVVISGSRKDEIVGRTLEESFCDKLTTLSIVLGFVAIIIFDISVYM